MLFWLSFALVILNVCMYLRGFAGVWVRVCAHVTASVVLPLSSHRLVCLDAPPPLPCVYLVCSVLKSGAGVAQQTAPQMLQVWGDLKHSSVQFHRQQRHVSPIPCPLSLSLSLTPPPAPRPTVRNRLSSDRPALPPPLLLSADSL